MSKSKTNKELLSGNESVALGAYLAGAKIGVAYPGTPSTEAMESFAKLNGVYAEWAPNEKVALEVAIGASMFGVRSLVTMKHVGVNVAADPLFTLAYTGVNGGLVLLAADDPGIYSSQNEQDSRYYSMATGIPMLEPSDSQEAIDMTKEAYELSENFDLPIIVRSTVRLSHTKCVVNIDEDATPTNFEQKPYKKDIDKWVMMPVYAKKRRTELENRLEKVRDFAKSSNINKIELRDTDIGIVCSGISYQNVREALPDVSILKLGMVYPLSKTLIEDFASKVKYLYVIEEGSTYLSTLIKSFGIKLDVPIGGCLPAESELMPSMIRKAFGVKHNDAKYAYKGVIPSRPPALCPGCPHRIVFEVLASMKAIVTGDIGCYTLGANAPLSAMDSCVDMGASISMAHGMELAYNFSSDTNDKKQRPIVAVIGDSTFSHSGISSLLGTIYNNGCGTVCILDNRTTAMTGKQGNPINGQALQDREANELDLMNLLRGIGVCEPKQVDPMIRKDVRQVLKAAINNNGLDVIVFKSPCYLLHRDIKKPYRVNGDCRACGSCIKIGCPALGVNGEGRAFIDDSLCVGCGQCFQYCNFGAIEKDFF